MATISIQTSLFIRLQRSVVRRFAYFCSPGRGIKLGKVCAISITSVCAISAMQLPKWHKRWYGRALGIRSPGRSTRARLAILTEEKVEVVTSFSSTSLPASSFASLARGTLGF